jgi:hypothetical protein
MRHRSDSEYFWSLQFTPSGAHFGVVLLPPFYWVAFTIILPSCAVHTQVIKNSVIRRCGSS